MGFVVTIPIKKIYLKAIKGPSSVLEKCAIISPSDMEVAQIEIPSTYWSFVWSSQILLLATLWWFVSGLIEIGPVIHQESWKCGNYVYWRQIGRLTTRGPWATLLTRETVPINKHFSAKLWLYHNVDLEIKIVSPFWELNGCYSFKVESPSPKKALCQVWMKLALWFWKRRILISQFRYYRSFRKGRGPLWMNPLFPWMICAKFGWNWTKGSWKEGF